MTHDEKPGRCFINKVLAVVVTAALVGSLFYLLYPVQRTPEEAYPKSANSLKVIALALQNYHEENGQLPPAVVRDKNGRPLYSWRVLLLPYLDEDRLYRQFHLDEPWDSPHNRKLLAETPSCYGYGPLLGDVDPPGLTRFQVLVGPGTAFERPGLTWQDFPHGPSATILVAEAAEPVPWSKPTDLAYDPNKLLPRLGGVFTKPVHFLGRVVRRDPGFVACFGDGSVHFIPRGTDEGIIRRLISRDGGGEVDLAKLD